MTCPSAFALDDLSLHGGGSADLATHVAACPACQAYLAAQAAEAERFALAAPAVWRRVVETGRRAHGRRWPRAWLGVPLALAGTLAAWVVLAPVQPPPYTGAKGAFALTVVARRGGEVFTADGLTLLRGGDELRFVPGAAARPGFIVIVSVDGTGALSHYVPSDPDAESLPLPPVGEPLPGSIVLDDAPGPERLLVVLTSRPVPARAARTLAEAGGGEPDAALRTAGARVFWLRLDKERPGAR